ncbi:hypothetical protein ACOSQ2_028065 [Xanthoceras sorbifolium]
MPLIWASLGLAVWASLSPLAWARFLGLSTWACLCLLLGPALNQLRIQASQSQQQPSGDEATPPNKETALPVQKTCVTKQPPPPPPSMFYYNFTQWEKSLNCK